MANTLNLTRASERLGISQPSLSLAVVRLEENVGTTLLIRQKRGVNLTQAGKQLLNHTKQLLQQWQEMKTRTLASQQAVQGYYTIGCHPSLGKYILPTFLPELVRTFPKLEINLKHDLSRKITEKVISLNIDMAIAVNPIRHPDLIIYKLFNDRVMLWQNNKLRNINNLPLICDPELLQTQAILKQLKAKQYSHSRMMTSNNLEVISALVAKGCGIGILPERVVKSTYERLVHPVIDSPCYKDEICLIYRHENRNVLAIQTIIAAIKQSCKK